MRLIVEADGGSRGNPGIAGYGALVRDAASGGVLTEVSAYLGDSVTNNVAEYSGLIAGLEAANTIDPGATLEVRMDSKLVVSQMSGAWKIKHPDLLALAQVARALVGSRRPKFVWVPRAQNGAADALANQAMDLKAPAHRPPAGLSTSAAVGEPGPFGVDDAASPAGGPVAGGEQGTVPDLFESAQTSRHRGTSSATKAVGSAAAQDADAGKDTGVAAAVRMAQAAGSGTQRHTGFDGPITTVIIVRHGMSVDTGRDVFAGNVVPGPSLSPDGLAQAQAASREIRRMIDVPWFGLHAPVGAIASPTARTMETAAELAAPWGLEIGTDAGFIEQNFGEWDGLTALQVRDRWPGGVERWASDPDYHPGDGESRREVGDRVKAALTQVVDRWCGRCVLIASHAVATRAAIGAALGAPPEAWACFRIAPASINVLRFWASGPTEVVCTNRTV